MFTGIVEEKGTVKKFTLKPNLLNLTVKANKVVRGVKKGESVSVEGVCLTVSKIKDKDITFDVMKETLQKTTLKNLKPQKKVNLERALKANSRFGGHFVTGHVDDKVQIIKKIKRPNYLELQFKMKKFLKPFLVEKGSVCIDGVSLTLGKVAGSYFSVYLIPLTLKITTLGQKNVSDFVNIEVDIIAKYLFNGKKFK